MATSPLAQVPLGSLDIAGVSIATQTPTLADKRVGTIYNLTDLAAAAPVWFHPCSDGRFLMISARRWYDAAPVGGIPGSFSSYEEDIGASWALIDGPSGRRSPIPGSPMSIPMNTEVDSRVVTAAVSRPPTQLFLLNAVTVGSDAGAVLQRLAVAADGTVSIAVEETLPTIVLGEDNTVVFDKGLQFQDPWLYLYGTDANDRVYRIRKPASHVGANKAVLTSTTLSGLVGTPQGWDYFNGSGYSLTPTEASPVHSALGILTTAGPMSFASYRTTTVMTTVENVAGVRQGRVWRSVVSRLAHKGEAIALGNADTYQGGGVALQPLLAANVASGVATAIPYVVSTIEDIATRLTVVWDLLPVTG